uniref:S2_1.2 n=1 Tax=Homo sapiens TaxID=9606 RepID=UPI00144A4CAA|nr:Chain C, S2_1.2 [Homo sapiens]6XXV_F Chain F, S2_1.2 [Homo sapiens]
MASREDMREEADEDFKSFVEAAKDNFNKFKARLRKGKITREHREMMKKLAKQNANKAKEAVRKRLSELLSKINDMPITNDQKKLMSNQVLQFADDAEAEIDQLAAKATKEFTGGSWLEHHHHHH